MYDRMIHEHGYSIRKLAEKLGKDKGYLENRLRLADAPPEVRELVSLRKDTLSHAYELMKVDGPEEAPPAGRPGRPRRALAGQAAREDRGPARSSRLGRRRTRRRCRRHRTRLAAPSRRGPDRWDGRAAGGGPIADDASSTRSTSSPMPSRTSSASSAIQDVLTAIGQVDRANLAKYLTIAKLRLENAIAVVRDAEITDRT